jgi:predicted helicase
MAPYYAAIRSAAAQIGTHHEKQTFLKVIYENFYKVYNPKAADRLGVIYTPNEIVRFMIESADYLCEKHFGRNLIDKDVEILDPAAGTATFVCEMLEHFRGQPIKLKHKYLEELHANEVAILPYYVANLNIEATYAAIAGEYQEYPNLCFVDTLDNTYALRKYRGHMDDLFGGLSDDNVRRIRRQNSRKISVIIGNPPYNANQLNENENNKNREYPEIDKRIKETYIEASTAQKTKVYDMYARFFRWAADRLDENGILALITNRSFIETRTFDGFRKVVAEEFNEIYVIDLGGDVRANPKLSGTKHNVFGIQTGVAISFMVKRAKAKGCRIFYARRPELETAEEKLAWLGSRKLLDIPCDEVRPDKKQNWINQADNDFDGLLPMATREGKRSRNQMNARAVFGLFASGIKTNRDDWVYDFADDTLRQKVRFFHDKLKALASKNLNDQFGTDVKWSRDLKLKLKRGPGGVPAGGQVVEALWRPFVRKSYWVNKTLSDILTEHHFRIFGPRLDKRNPTIAFLCVYSSHPIAVMLSTGPFDYCLLKTGNGGTESVPLFTYDTDGTQKDNITDWGLDQFRKHYQTNPEKKQRPISKENIFHYVYGLLHNPVYREKYALNLKREFPRIPFYKNFWQWAEWGKELDCAPLTGEKN